MFYSNSCCAILQGCLTSNELTFKLNIHLSWDNCVNIYLQVYISKVVLKFKVYV